MSEINAAPSFARPAARPNKRLVVPLAALILCFGAICTYILIEARQATWDRAGDVAARLVAAIESDVAGNLETLDLSMQAVIDNLNRPDVESLTPELRQLILFDRSAAARHLGSMLVLDEAGNIRMDSRNLSPKSINLADRDYFQAHRNSDSAGIFISRPLTSRITGEQIVVASRRLSRPDGSFAGVVVGSLRLSSFQSLFKGTTLGPGSNITLSRTDGIVLTRWPYKPEYIGLDARRAALFGHLAAASSGRFETTAVTDGVRRLFVYSKIGDLPLVVAVGQSNAEIFRQWNRYAVAVGALVAALCVLGLALAVKLFGELQRRSDAEAQLALLAAVDPLTGISNRRQFDTALDREWRRASRDRSPVSLLMIDIDLFKSYNDQNGHQAGDALLKTLANCITPVLKRGFDVGARYGGDEFAILLPGASLSEAAETAGRIRAGFREACAGTKSENMGVSIGVACATPGAGEACSKLVKSADRALYRAKHLGRNRTELAPMPATVESSDTLKRVA